MNCKLCAEFIYPDTTGEPFLVFNNNTICSECYIGIIPKIYKMAGAGDGGLIHLVFQSCLTSSHNRKNRKQIPGYKKQLNKLLHKYRFKCVYCASDKYLTIDHIIPVSRGGTDNPENLQVACKSCNSKKGSKTHKEFLDVMETAD